RSTISFFYSHVHSLHLHSLPTRRSSDLSSLKHYGNQLVLVQEFREGDYYCASAVAISVSGNHAISEQINEMTLRLLIDYSSKETDRKSTRLNSSHVKISYAVFCLKKKKK